MNQTLGVYAGTFDPITVGHEHVLARAASLFERMQVMVAGSPTGKQPMFEAAHRMELVKLAVEQLGLSDRVQVEVFDGLLVPAVAELAPRVRLVRGLRAVSDFEAEQAMAHANRALAVHKGLDLDTVFIATDPSLAFVSSSLVRELVRNHEDASQWLGRSVAARMETLSLGL